MMKMIHVDIFIQDRNKEKAVILLGYIEFEVLSKVQFRLCRLINDLI